MPNRFTDAAEAAGQLALALGRRGQDYAIGGAIALGYWSQPRGTIDVDLTLLFSPTHIAEGADPRFVQRHEIVAEQG